jgi:hypothetical protein
MSFVFNQQDWCDTNRVHEIAYGLGSPSEKKCQSPLIFYCKIPILCQSLSKICPNFAGHVVNSVPTYVVNQQDPGK